MNQTVGIKASKWLPWFDWQPLVRHVWFPSNKFLLCFEDKGIMTSTTFLIWRLHHELFLTFHYKINGSRFFEHFLLVFLQNIKNKNSKNGWFDADHEIIVSPPVRNNYVLRWLTVREGVKRRTCWVGRRPRGHVHPHARVESDVVCPHKHKKQRALSYRQVAFSPRFTQPTVRPCTFGLIQSMRFAVSNQTTRPWLHTLRSQCNY